MVLLKHHANTEDLCLAKELTDNISPENYFLVYSTGGNEM